MSSITRVTESGGYDVVVRMYSDDLALDLWRLYQPDESYFADHRFHGPDHYYQRYINDNFNIIINGDTASGMLREVEKLELETIIRMVVEPPDKVYSLRVENRIMTGLYPDQVNLFIFKDSLDERAFRFTPQHFSELLFDHKGDSL
jgi:hypothetical protein